MSRGSCRCDRRCRFDRTLAPGRRGAAAHARGDGRGVPARDLLLAGRLAPARDEARRAQRAVRAVLRRRPAARRGEDDVPPRPAVAHPRARPELPRRRRDQLQRLGRWIAANGSSWYDAGVEARKRMAAQGFDVGAGDTWAINESSSAVRTGAGVARQNLRDLVRGLYTGAGGTGVKGIVFVVGVGQTGTSLSTYKGTLQLWFADERVLERHELVRERLVAGGVRRRHEVRRRRRNARRAARRAQRMAAASALARERLAAGRGQRPRERSCRARTARSRTLRGGTARARASAGRTSRRR